MAHTNLYKDEMENLELLIDSHGILGVLDAIAEICYGKEQHLQENWQDYETAKVWHKLGINIQKFAFNKIKEIQEDLI